MFPERELNRLSAQKASLQLDIAIRRARCAKAVARLAKPLEWLDRAATLWRKFSPIIQISALPLGFLAKRVLLPRFKILGALARWGPLAFSAFRGMSSVFGSRGAPRE